MSRIITGRGVAITALAAACAAIVMGRHPRQHRRRRAAVPEGRCVHDGARRPHRALRHSAADRRRRCCRVRGGNREQAPPDQDLQRRRYPGVRPEPPRRGGHSRRRARRARPGRQRAHDRRAGAGPDEIGVEDAHARSHSCGDAAARSRGVLRPGAVADPAHARRGRRRRGRGGEGRHERYGARQPGGGDRPAGSPCRRHGSGWRQRHGDVPGRGADDAGLDRAASSSRMRTRANTTPRTSRGRPPSR